MLRRLLIPVVVSLALLAFAAPAHAGAAPDIDRIYRSSEGSIVSFRVVGSNVYGFAENPSMQRATVLTGEIDGTRISGRWYDVPKGERREEGDLELDVSANGKRIFQAPAGDAFGPYRLRQTAASGFDWPAPTPAAYQGLGNDDFTGRFVGDDGSRWWVHETQEGKVLMVGEREQQLGVRPNYTSVVVAQRLTDRLIAGTWADVRKGMQSRTGNFVAGVTKFRVLRLHGMGQRTRKLRPVYSWDFDAFAHRIEGDLDGKVVGYSYAIAFKGSLVRQGAGGWRTFGVDGYRPFEPDTESSTASTAKTISAAVMLDVLHRRGISLDARVGPYLPSCWKKGPGIGTLTFRDLLSHRSRLSESASQIGVSCKDDPWKCLLRVIELGRVEAAGYDYNNYNYALLRILAPSAWLTAHFRELVESKDCEQDAEELNYQFSSVFEAYTRSVLFTPAGIHDGFGKPENHAYLYASGDPFGPGIPVEGAMEKAGAGRIAMSAPQFARFLTALDSAKYGSWLPAKMKSTLIGFDPSGSFEGKLGEYYGKNGGCPTGACKAQAMIFPHGVQAYVMTNSTTEAVGSSLREVLMDGYRAALQ